MIVTGGMIKFHLPDSFSPIENVLVLTLAEVMRSWHFAQGTAGPSRSNVGFGQPSANLRYRHPGEAA
jgi:hypothetical protein